MKAVHNERVKLSATFLNGIAIAVFIIGTFTPAVQIARSASTVGLTPAVATGAICIVGAIGLHFTARAILGRLME